MLAGLNTGQGGEKTGSPAPESLLAVPGEGHVHGGQDAPQRSTALCRGREHGRQWDWARQDAGIPGRQLCTGAGEGWERQAMGKESGRMPESANTY